MKTRKLNKRERWRLHKAIWNIYQSEKLVVTDSYERQKEVAQKILDKYPELSVDLVSTITTETVIEFLEKNNMATTDEYWLFDQMVIYTLRNILNKYEPKLETMIKWEKPKRMVSPPFEAYYDRGHSSLNVGPNRIPDDQMRQMKHPYV